jgi:hypothetical protein
MKREQMIVFLLVKCREHAVQQSLVTHAGQPQRITAIRSIASEIGGKRPEPREIPVPANIDANKATV